MLKELPVKARLKWLIILHLLVGIAPLASFSLPNGTWTIEAGYALGSLTFAQLMLLSFWVGMSGDTGIVRAVGGLLGTAYIATWPVLAQYVSPHFVEHELPPITRELLVRFSSFAAFTLLFSGCFVLLRRKGTTLEHLSTFDAAVERPRVKYSVLHLLVLMSTCSLLLSLARIAQPTDQTDTEQSTLSLVAIFILMMVVFAINSICAAWASLSLNSPWSRIGLTVGIAILLGISFGVATGHYSLSWRIFIPVCLIPVLSTAIVIVSLLVVRSCGYRLVPSESLQAAP